MAEIKKKITRYDSWEIASSVGYTPCRTAMRTAAFYERRINEWLDDIERGVRPRGLETVNNAVDMVLKEAVDFADLELKWARYFYQPMRTELDVNVSGEVSHDHKHTHEQLSETAEWVAELLGGIEEGEIKGSVSH